MAPCRNLSTNLELVEGLRALSQGLGGTVAQVAIAWVAAQGPDIVPLVGARRRDQLTEALGAIAMRLSPEQLRTLSEAVPAEAVAGDRYPAALLKHLDSETAVD
jgi:pyridoxine 4-dehydrogenase